MHIDDIIRVLQPIAFEINSLNAKIENRMFFWKLSFPLKSRCTMYTGTIKPNEMDFHCRIKNDNVHSVSTSFHRIWSCHTVDMIPESSISIFVDELSLGLSCFFFVVCANFSKRNGTEQNPNWSGQIKSTIRESRKKSSFWRCRWLDLGNKKSIYQILTSNVNLQRQQTLLIFRLCHLNFEIKTLSTSFEWYSILLVHQFCRRFDKM